MSLLSKTEKIEEVVATPLWKQMLVPVYILISGLFILYIAFTYLSGVIYQSGQQQGYVTAVQDLATQVTAACEPVAISLGEQQIDVVNVACLQEAPATTDSAVLQTPKVAE